MIGLDCLGNGFRGLHPDYCHHNGIIKALDACRPWNKLNAERIHTESHGRLLARMSSHLDRIRIPAAGCGMNLRQRTVGMRRGVPIPAYPLPNRLAQQPRKSVRVR